MSLDKLGNALQEAIRKVMRAPVVDEKIVKELIRDIQRAMLQADVNVQLVLELSSRIEERGLKEKLPPGISRRDVVLKVVYEELIKLLGGEQLQELKLAPDKPNVIMFVGIQGSGKTTTIGKIASYLKKRNQKVSVVCADNFRAGALDQLSQLALQVEVPIYGSSKKKSAVELAKEGVKKFTDENYSVILVDTAGRHKQEAALIDEMKEIAGAVKPDEIILVVDGTIGQQAFSQAKAFHEATPIGSIIVSKLDGAARGGGALSAVAATGAPIRFIGTGEKIEEIETFAPPQFVSRILGMGDLKALVEKVREAEIQPSPEALQALATGRFTLQDMLVQLKSLRKMGPLGKLLKLVPGMGLNLPVDKMDVDEKKVDRWIAMMQSMTKEELTDPEKIDRSRMRRIARGSGTQQKEVKELVNQYFLMKKLFKQFMRQRRKTPLGPLKDLMRQST